MQQDRFTRVVLGIIAAGLWALTLTQLEIPTARADSPRSLERHASSTFPGATSTRPLRWRIGFAAHLAPDIDGANECSTTVSLLSTAPVSNSVDVEFFDHNAAPVGMATLTVAAGDSRAPTTTGGTAFSTPFSFDPPVSTGNFVGGFALVHADDPRIQVAAFFYCKEDRENVASITDPVRSVAAIPAYPVGASLDLFQAGTPGAGEMPRVAAASESESPPR